ncbi:phosphate acetyltransferase [Natronospirillum operosum]|uniref:Phosphate acetyltransferase n=1 Tax=Natronospirillum operosum TaxID=2759953 RepID=A0A4Z0WB81_9GAMM|nr:phosphate acetyltransferase [Natronospirillum operosum]TGG95014.1 phosphate acetyltransferase [Natronospirillum operosum]
MQNAFFLSPTGAGTGLTSVTLGLIRAMDQLGIRVAFCKPIAQIHEGEGGTERSTLTAEKTLGMQPAEPLSLSYAQSQLTSGNKDQLMEEIIQLYQQSARDADLVIVEGLVPDANDNYLTRLNIEMAKALDALVILVSAKNDFRSEELNERLRMAASLFGGTRSPRVLGCILNKVGAPPAEYQTVRASDGQDENAPREITIERIREKLSVFDDDFLLLGAVRWNPSLVAPRTSDVADYLEVDYLSQGASRERRVQSITLCARTMPNMLHTLKPGALVVTPGDRDDILLAACMAALNHVPLAGLLLTGDMKPTEQVLELCRAALHTGLPVMLTPHNTYTTAQWLNHMNTEVPVDDQARMELVMDAVAAALDAERLAELARVQGERRQSPPAFRHYLIKRAHEARKRIVLPEGDEPRTVQAAAQCQSRGIAQCVLLGKREDVLRVAENQGVTLPDEVEIIDPDEVRERYIGPMVKLRSHKGLTEPMAEAQLEDTVMLATMMLALDEVDGLVSGAVHTTANTIRPALQLIKTKPDATLVSSVFFMLLPDQVYVYGDCAVNPDPNAEELADIAIQSGDSAIAFGIEPRIAMISYSTGSSGTGADVDKVRQATELAREKRPDLLIDGPLQYDAAAIASVASSKAPDSPVAGRATVFVFPDLNTGNTTYKAVQRSANVVSIGPMLQGLRKPVNDLSRGALVEDIVYTIALTAIQAAQNDA